MEGEGGELQHGGCGAGLEVQVNQAQPRHHKGRHLLRNNAATSSQNSFPGIRIPA
jgi:hypothetical protein